MDLAARIVDAALELPVAPGFSRIGAVVRSRTAGWSTRDRWDLEGRVIVLTGATSGIGRAAAERLLASGATVVVVGRDRARTAAACESLGSAVGREVPFVLADMADRAAVRDAAAEILRRWPRVDVLVHNAGALLAQRTEVDGIEATVAAQVVGPFLLTSLLLDRLRSSSGRVVTVSSGGMYAVPLCVDDLEMGDDYSGSTQYARAKRAQVTLDAVWATRECAKGVVFHSMHPGWADTPGVASSLPTFRRVVGPLLRTPAEGADTVVWLAADDTARASSGLFWCDRRDRPIHRLSSTRRSDTPKRRTALWARCVELAGIDPGS